MTASHLLSTKFLVPRPSPDHLLRSHLSDRLERAALHKRLTLLSAPPGYGKTTLLVELVGRGAMPCAWLQLDPTDSDPNIFLTCLVEAVRRMHGLETQERLHEFGASALALLENSGANAAVAPERILTVLINELSDIQAAPWIFVFEDYHLVANPVVHNLMNMLMEQGPAEMHVIASSRVDPPLALARLRARGQLEELRVPELRFSAGEVRARVEQAERLPKLSDADVALLHEKTEGWAAALQIVLSSLANADAQSANQFIERLSGIQRHIFAFLADEVFRRHARGRQDFLMKTAILAQMNAQVCNRLLGIDDAQTQLEQLEQENLFVVSLDETRAWYRYHHLFREFLLARLMRETPVQRLLLESSAGVYYEQHGELEAAFGHYLRGQQVDAASRVLTQLAPEYIERGRTAVLQRYMADIPPETMCDHPELILYAGMALHRLGQLSAATVRYEEARRLFADRPDPQGVCRALIQLAEVARAQGDYVRGQVLASQALDHAPEEDHASRAIALMALARCEGFLTGMDRGRALAEASVAAARQADDAISPRTRADLLRALGHICWWSGDPGATVRFCQEALQSIPDELSPIAANAYITMATPYTYWCDVDTALDCAQRGLEMVQQMDLTELLPRAYATLGAVMTKRGELDQGERYLRQAIDLAFQLGVDTYAQIIATGYLASNLVAQDRIEEARQVAETALWTQGSDPNTYEIIFCRSMLADIALAQGQLDEAEMIFLHLRTVTERRQFRIPLAMIDFGLAYLRLTQGREAEGLAYGRRAISALEPIGTIQLFLDQGHRARVVCRALESSGDRSRFVAEVLDRLSSVPSDGAPVDEDHTVGLRVHCLGPFRVFIDGEEIPAERWDSVKARDLLAYFIHFRHARVTIEMALLDMWADDDGAKKTAFHSALYRLRQAIRHETPHARPILVKGGDYWLDANWISVDVDDFDRLIQRARSAPSRETAAGFMETAVDLYEGEYLSSLRYYDWAMAERRRLAEAHIQALCALAEFQLDRGCPELALGFVRRALHHDPLREEVYTTAMRAHAALGDRDGLVRQHRRLASVLAAELELEPLPETERLYQLLLHDLESA